MAMSRRQFATLMGTSVVTASTLPSLLSRVTAQAPRGPVRFLAVRTPHGVNRDFWIPKTSDNKEPPADEALSSLTFEYEDNSLSPLMAWRDQITVLDGLDTAIGREQTRSGVTNNFGHNEQGVLLTGAQPPSDRDGEFGDGHPSLDFYLHGRLNAPVLLAASVTSMGSSWKPMSRDNSGRARPPETDPRDLFRQAFPSDYVPDDPTEPTVDYVPGERRIALSNLEELKRLEQRLSGREREKVQGHREAFERLVPDESSGSGFIGSCTTRGTDVPSDNGDARDPSDVPRITRAHARVIGQAFACGRARCATLHILHDNVDLYRDIPEVREIANAGGVSLGDGMHNVVHKYWDDPNDPDYRGVYTAGLRVNASNFAVVLDELASMPDPLDPNGGTILDNTVIFWHSEFGHDGHDDQETRHPAIIAGGGGRTLRLGRYLRLRRIYDSDGRHSSERVPHNKLLVSLAHAVGVTDIDYFGDRDVRDNGNYRGPLLPLMA